MTYWETYKTQNPKKAEEIESLGLEFSKLPDKEVEEKVFALETTAHDSSCSISELKKILFAHEKDESYYLYMMEYFDKKTFKEAEKYNIERTNTIWMIIEGWILEKVEEIEKKYAGLPPRSKKDPITLLMQFQLEDPNEFSVLRKTHIYLKNYPMLEINKRYVGKIESVFDKYLNAYIKPIAENNDNKKNPFLFNILVRSQGHIACEKIKEDGKELIMECNNHDISFYAELDLAFDRAIVKYSIPT